MTDPLRHLVPNKESGFLIGSVCKVMSYVYAVQKSEENIKSNFFCP